MLQLKGLESGYGNKKVLNDIHCEIEEDSIVGIIGHNGAGKSTLLHTMFGLIRPWAGKIIYHGEDLSNQSVAARVQRGIRLLPSSHSIFPGLSVDENIRLVEEQVRSIQKGDMIFQAHSVYDLFPELQVKRKQPAGNLSGGQQRMLAVGMGLIGRPRLLLLDELSIGLAPALVQRILETLLSLSRQYHFGMVIVEQNVGELQAICDRLLIMRNGTFIEDRRAHEISVEELWELF